MKTAALLVLLAVVAGSLAQNYCGLCPDHTMCKYRSPGPKCGRILASGVTSAQRDAIVAAHNELRARVANGQEGKGKNGGQPGAANMRKMVWDDELATVAQRWTDQCDFGHDACRKVSRFGVGQNAYMMSTSGNSPIDPSEAVRSWYSEVKDFSRNDISPFRISNGPVVGHYTQVAWAESYRVGCGHTRFPDGNWFRSIVVCNYGPAGNMINGVMYKQGRACSQCPAGTRCQNGLCA